MTLQQCLAKGLKAADVAYILATEYHETAGTFQPIRERGGSGYFFRMYDVRGSRPKLARDNGNVHPGDGVLFYGRGEVQITWRGNYRRIGRLLGLGDELENNPDKALDPVISTRILVEGMMGGWFTGAHLRRYLPRTGLATRAQFRDARRIVNGVDKADKLAGYALEFQDYLVASGWPQ